MKKNGGTECLDSLYSLEYICCIKCINLYRNWTNFAWRILTNIKELYVGKSGWMDNFGYGESEGGDSGMLAAVSVLSGCDMCQWNSSFNPP